MDSRTPIMDMQEQRIPYIPQTKHPVKVQSPA